MTTQTTQENELVTFVESLVQSNSNDIFTNNCCFTGATFPVAGYLVRLEFCELTKSDREYFLEHKTLPESVLNPKLKIIGFGRKYWNTDPDKIRCKEVFSYIDAIVSGDRRGFLLLGPYGTGKTTIMAYTAKQLLLNSIAGAGRIRFVPSDVLYQIIFRRENETFDELIQVPYLMIDDLGRTYDSAFPTAMFESLMCQRYDNLLPTFFTTNKSVKQLRNHEYWGSVIDRIRDKEWMQPPLQISGESMR